MNFVQKILFVRLISSIDSTFNAAILTVFRFNWERSFYVWMLTSSSCYDITTLANLKKITGFGKYFRIFCCFTNGFLASRIVLAGPTVGPSYSNLSNSSIRYIVGMPTVLCASCFD